MFPEATGTITEAHTGCWYNVSKDGSGFLVYVTGDDVVVYWFTYSHKGERIWFWAHGSIEAMLEGVILKTKTGGTWELPVQAVSKDVGFFRIQFYDNDHGMVNWNMPEFGEDALEIERII